MLTTVNLFSTNGQRYTPIEPKRAAVAKKQNNEQSEDGQSDLEMNQPSRLFILPYLSSHRETRKHGDLNIRKEETSDQLKKLIAQPEIDSEVLPKVLEWCEKVNPVGKRVAYPPSLSLSVPKCSAV